jgi:hypothetical protein
VIWANREHDRRQKLRHNSQDTTTLERSERTAAQATVRE